MVLDSLRQKQNSLLVYFIFGLIIISFIMWGGMGNQGEPDKEMIRVGDVSVTPQSGDHETLERALASFLGTKVSIASKGDYSKGQIVIDFYSKEDLDRILDLIRNT